MEDSQEPYLQHTTLDLTTLLFYFNIDSFHVQITISTTSHFPYSSLIEVPMQTTILEVQKLFSNAPNSKSSQIYDLCSESTHLDCLSTISQFLFYYPLKAAS